MFRARRLLILCCFSLTMCATKPQTGVMAADWTPPEASGIPAQRVIIAWESDSRTTGNMTFTLGRGGQRYVGSYLLLEKTTSHVDIQPLYNIWDSADFGPYTAAAEGFPWFEPVWGISTWVHHYDGRVVVGLHGNRNGSARCRFTLSNTEHGLVGGGKGQCQVDDGGHLDVRF
jgi:hypothetical protein